METVQQALSLLGLNDPNLLVALSRALVALVGAWTACEGACKVIARCWRGVGRPACCAVACGACKAAAWLRRPSKRQTQLDALCDVVCAMREDQQSEREARSARLGNLLHTVRPPAPETDCEVQLAELPQCGCGPDCPGDCGCGCKAAEQPHRIGNDAKVPVTRWRERPGPGGSVIREIAPDCGADAADLLDLPHYHPDAHPLDATARRKGQA